MIFSKQKRNEYIGFDDKWFFLLGIPLLGVFVPVAFFKLDFASASPALLLRQWVQAMSHSMIYWIGIRSFMVFIRKRLSGFELTRRRIILTVIFIMVYGALAGALLSFFYVRFLGASDGNTPLEGFISTYFTSFFIVSIYEGIYLYHQNRLNILQTEKLKRETIKSELQGLRNQVNPHFLFNSMNTLMNIINEDKGLAISFLKKLSIVYRYVLDKSDDQLITLEEELKFIESYIFLQKERFKHNLDVTLEINDAFVNRLVLPLSLQLLFENAIKHNVISSRKPLLIEVYIDQNQKLVVKNNFQPKKQIMPSTGIGLKNIENRLHYFTKEKVEIIETEHDFMVKIPLLHKEEVVAV